MRVARERPKTDTEAPSSGFVATLLADDFETRDRLKARIRPETPERVDSEAPAPAATPTDDSKPAPKAPRLIALDAFRGLTVLLMLIVNNIALDTYTPDAFTHGAWGQGLRLADYVFPWFLLCVGLSIPFSFASCKRRGLPSWRLDLKIVGRAVALVLLGCVLNAAITRQVVFTLGVLQLIGLAYLVAAFAYELPIIRRGIIATFMLVGYGLAIKFLPTPGSPVGTFQENANFIDHINRTYLLAYNLDGLFSVIPTAALMIFATMVGDALANRKLNSLRRLAIMAVSGVAMAGTGMFVNLFIPYNKPVWTPSYILLTGGVGILVLAGFYLFTDAVKWSKWPYPLLVFGSNAIVAYAAPVFIKVMVFSTWTVHTHDGVVSLQDACLNTLVERLGRIPGGWTYTGVYIGCCWLILALLYRRRTFLRV